VFKKYIKQNVMRNTFFIFVLLLFYLFYFFWGGGSVISAGTVHDLRRVKVPGVGPVADLEGGVCPPKKKISGGQNHKYDGR
jgi:hypothetical protein